MRVIYDILLDITSDKSGPGALPPDRFDHARLWFALACAAAGMTFGAIWGWSIGGVGGVLIFVPIGLIAGFILGTILSHLIPFAVIWIVGMSLMILVFYLAYKIFDFLWGLGI